MPQTKFRIMVAVSSNVSAKNQSSQPVSQHARGLFSLPPNMVPVETQPLIPRRNGTLAKKRLQPWTEGTPDRNSAGPGLGTRTRDQRTREGPRLTRPNETDKRKAETWRKTHARRSGGHTHSSHGQITKQKPCRKGGGVKRAQLYKMSCILRRV